MKTAFVAAVVLGIFLGLVAYSEAIDWAAVKAKKDEYKRTIDYQLVLVVEVAKREKIVEAERIETEVIDEKVAILFGVEEFDNAIEKKALKKDHVIAGHNHLKNKFAFLRDRIEKDMSKLKEENRKQINELLDKILTVCAALAAEIIELLGK